MKKNNSYITLYPNIIPVRGFNRSTLMDLYMGNYQFIPNYLCDFLISNKRKNLRREDFLDLSELEEDKNEILELIQQLIAKDYLLETDMELLKALRVEEPNKTEDSLIADCIIELSSISDWGINLFFSEINRIGVKFLEIRFLDFIAFERHFKTIELAIKDHSLEFVHLLVPFDENLKKWVYGSLNQFSRLNLLTVYNTNHSFDTKDCSFQVTFSTQTSIDQNQCGCISPNYFNINVLNYYYNRKVNNCLAYKLSIDQYGEIRNCPSKKESFGKMRGFDLEKIVQLKTFQKEWHITKESILICSDCEFRWMCSDCRVFIQDESNIYSKPSKCGYNPYISKWIHEDGYKAESECGISVKNGNLIIDENQLNKINKVLWD